MEKNLNNQTLEIFSGIVFCKVFLNVLLFFTNKLNSYNNVYHLLIQFTHAVRSYFCSVLKDNLSIIFLWNKFFWGMGERGFCNVQQKKSIIFVINMRKLITFNVSHLQMQKS